MFRKTSLIIILLLLTLTPISAQALDIVPNDPFYDTQYYLQHSKIDQAWEYSSGSEGVTVAIIDSGVDIDHPDLKENIWINTDEIAENGIDDDKNGYIDDVHGWNFVENNNDPNPQFNNYSIEGASHGTLVAGIIGAVGHNNKGVAGINWSVKLMPLRALNNKGEGEMPEAIEAIRYATVNGADIINMSFVGTTYSEELEKVIQESYRKGVLIVAAVGNDGMAQNGKTAGGNLDTRPIYPACFNSALENLVIGVGAVDRQNKKAPFSHYGKTCIDINVLGVDIVSTQTLNPKVGSPFNAEISGFWKGTSFASPQVAGVAALIKSINPEYNNNQITSLLLDTADPIDDQNPEFKGLLGKGLLNAKRALRAAAPVTFTTSDPRETINIKRFNKAIFIKEDIITRLTTQSVLPVKMQFKNTGSITLKYHQLELKITDWDNNPTPFFPNNVPIKNIEILPSQVIDINTLLASPNRHGTYKLKFQLFYQGISTKGGTLFKEITVTKSETASLTSHNLPLAVLQKWESIPVKITLTNNSPQTWKREETKLDIRTKYNGFSITQNKNPIILPQEKTIPPGGTATFTFTLHFNKARKGVNYYTFLLKKKDMVEKIEGGDGIIRVD